MCGGEGEGGLKSYIVNTFFALHEFEFSHMHTHLFKHTDKTYTHTHTHTRSENALSNQAKYFFFTESLKRGPLLPVIIATKGGTAP